MACSDIDVAKTLREKLNAEFRYYRIFGACNPQLARGALEAEAQLGLLLPSNVVVQSLAGTTVISAIDARAPLQVVGNPVLSEIADEVNARLARVLDRLGTETAPGLGWRV